MAKVKTASITSRDCDNDVTFIGSTTSPGCASAYNIFNLPTAMTLATTRTTSPLIHDYDDDVIYLGSRTDTTSTEAAQLSSTIPE
ncbi:hypothetical protein CKAH01_18931 [Colletotrichum kahawae]|uniref:Uncharacterized protein n=1 Tax=Colletotrichum kahawae TaxID=34407 RepID=A0AAE0D1E9_COLKA|nr:hypothetical protein CKAH01_18931 [Colletotrichum kahawae]